VTQVKHHLRLTKEQHDQLHRHLFKPDGCESVALALCGRRAGRTTVIHCVHEILEIPDAACALRTPVTVRWPVEFGMNLFAKAAKKGFTVLKIHTHPTGAEDFSTLDDESDRELLDGISRLADQPSAHLSAFMLPDGNIRARVWHDGSIRARVARVSIVGDDVQILGCADVEISEAELKTRQAFGEATTMLLKNMTIGVAGCSGTGSWVVEQLARLGVGRLVIVDPDRIEKRNLNRIVNSTKHSAECDELKIEVARRAVEAMGLDTSITCVARDLTSREAIEALAECDFLFGCLDSADGRDMLNRIATFYLVPFIDVGVRLDADGTGGIRQICGAIHFLLPGGSSLLSRGVIAADQITSHALHRHQPDHAARLADDGYIKGADVHSPAVVSINGFVASHAVNEMLARMHPYRVDENTVFRYQLFSLKEGAWLRLEDGPNCSVLTKWAGRGDVEPPLNNPGVQ
jgi:hypothetical protein